MDYWLLGQLQKKLKISPVEIIREEKEVLILDLLSKSKISKNLIFKGGTALRLVYGSPRFSQNLDFSLVKDFSFSFLEFKKFIKELKNYDSELSPKDIYNKRNTFFALIQVTTNLLSQQFSIKIEISKRDPVYKTNDFSLKIITSPVTILSPMLYVASLKRIFYEKKIAVSARKEPRDYFDLWWLAEKLKIKIKIPKPEIAKGKFKGEISQLLPNYLKNWPEEFLSSYERS